MIIHIDVYLDIFRAIGKTNVNTILNWNNIKKSISFLWYDFSLSFEWKLMGNHASPYFNCLGWYDTTDIYLYMCTYVGVRVGSWINLD